MPAFDDAGPRDRRPAAAEVANESVKRWREQQAKAGHAQHAEEHRGSERAAHLRAGSGGYSERCDTEYERERRHQDRTQTRARRVHGGAARARALMFFLAGELDDQDRIFGG